MSDDAAWHSLRFMLASSQTPACWRCTKFPKSCFTWRGLACSSCWFWEKLCPLTRVYHKPRRISRQIRLTLKQRPPRWVIQQTMNHGWQATPRRSVQHGLYINLLTNSSPCQMMQLGIACDSCWLQAKLRHAGVAPSFLNPISDGAAWLAIHVRSEPSRALWHGCIRSPDEFPYKSQA